MTTYTKKIEQIPEYRLDHAQPATPYILTSEDGFFPAFISVPEGGDVAEAVRVLAQALGRRITPDLREWMSQSAPAIAAGRSAVTVFGLPRRYKMAELAAESGGPYSVGGRLAVVLDLYTADDIAAMRGED